mgnify:CR=1 FL=1
MALIPPQSRPAKARGEVLFITIVLLLVIFLGFLYMTRHLMTEAQLAGNAVASQRNAQVADVVLRRIDNTITTTNGGMPLELSMAGQAWYRQVGAGTAAPTAAYWASCLGNADAGQRCGSVNVNVVNTALPYSALVVVQPTGRTDQFACGMSLFRAVYYDIYIQVSEQNGSTSAVTHTVYRLCTLS